MDAMGAVAMLGIMSVMEYEKAKADAMASQPGTQELPKNTIKTMFWQGYLCASSDAAKVANDDVGVIEAFDHTRQQIDEMLAMADNMTSAMSEFRKELDTYGRD